MNKVSNQNFEKSLTICTTEIKLLIDTWTQLEILREDSVVHNMSCINIDEKIYSVKMRIKGKLFNFHKQNEEKISNFIEKNN